MALWVVGHVATVAVFAATRGALVVQLEHLLDVPTAEEEQEEEE